MNIESDIDFLIHCVKAKRIYWTYHCNMRLGKRAITREILLDSLLNCEIIEHYPSDFPLPSCLCLCYYQEEPLHCVIGLDKAGENIRMITVYRPDLISWEKGFRERKKK